MKVLALTCLALIGRVASNNVNFEDVTGLEYNTAFGYHTKFGIPLTNQIREAEAQGQAFRIAGGYSAALGQFPYQVGLLIDLNFVQSVCGGSILNNRKVLTAAHCWFDGQNQAWRITVVAGSVLLFFNGQRQSTSNVDMHTGWNPNLLRDDIAMITLNSDLAFSNNVAAIALPSGNELQNNFAGWTGTASGFGRTSDISHLGQHPSLNYVNLTIITNAMCQNTFWTITASNICTSGANARSTCPGDAGGPLVVTSNNRRILVGVVSFSSAHGCTQGFPAAFARVTNYITWINTRL